MTSRRFLSLSVWLLSLLLVGAAGMWAGHVVTQQPSSVPSLARDSMEVSARSGSVGRTLTYNATITQTRAPLATNLLSGVVTSINTQDNYAQGDVVYTVDATPVRIIEGTRPFFRDLSLGAQGEDVAQLARALVSLGYLGWADDEYGPQTETAVKRWQRYLGQEQTGIITRGELLAVPTLPSTLLLDNDILRLGTLLHGDEALVYTPQGTPSFSLDLSPQQAQSIPSNAMITVTYQEYQWPAVIAGTYDLTAEDQGNDVTRFKLTAPQGGVVCGSDCHSLPEGERLYVPAAIEVVPSVSGVAIPVTALSTQPNGSVSVQVVTGSHVEDRTITLLASEDGIAIVEGIEEGERVRVYGSKAAATSSTEGDSSTSPMPEVDSHVDS